MPLRVAAISFLNPAPLLFDFEHEPTASALRSRYELHYTTPAHCARELHSGAADLGLIPIAELTPELAVVPGCTIASLREVRSILLLVKNPANLPVGEALSHVTTIATDSASRSSTAYAHILFEHFYNAHPTFTEHRADAVSMLSTADAALLIGDPALLARQNRSQIEAEIASQLDTDFAPGLPPLARPRHPLASAHRPPLGRRSLGRPTRGSPPQRHHTRTALRRPHRQPQRRPHPHRHPRPRVDPPHRPSRRGHPHLSHPEHPLHPRPRLPPRHRALPRTRHTTRRPPSAPPVAPARLSDARC